MCYLGERVFLRYWYILEYICMPPHREALGQANSRWDMLERNRHVDCLQRL